ncbi:MAG: 16S rRNA (cytosine(967)-C(5))-methyltransferase RsmB [Desulfobacterales bacterium]|nr:MAG: 16S rRNA (cytosine(967)-C(5))-methyltransferase RsmB [Desulfobacterales bacterium]
MPFDARKSALDMLNTLDRGQQTLDFLLEAVSADYSDVPRREQSLLRALVFGVLRWRGRLDYIISHFSRTRFDKINPLVLNVLRLALFQMIYLDRIPESAAVNTAVEFAKAFGAPWVVGYVNALLRKAAREYQCISLPDAEKDPIAALAVEKSFPEWIIRKWINRYGPASTANLCDSINTIAPTTVRTNTLRVSPTRLAETLSGEAGQVRQTSYAPDGITIVNPATAIPELSAFKSGCFQVQDEAAQLVSLLLDPQPGETVLDACAGLGGKTGHIAQLMKNSGKVVALDVNEKKLQRLEAEMLRLGMSIVSTHCHDIEKGVPSAQTAGFDRILLDAPCSGLGVMRRNPDIKWRTSKRNLLKYNARQIRLLENISHLVKPSGILVYAVCSPEPEENEMVIKEFLKKKAEFVINKEFGRLPDKLCTMQGSPGVFRTYPILSEMDGFFAIRLQKH